MKNFFEIFTEKLDYKPNHQEISLCVSLDNDHTAFCDGYDKYVIWRNGDGVLFLCAPIPKHFIRLNPELFYDLAPGEYVRCRKIVEDFTGEINIIKDGEILPLRMIKLEKPNELE